MKVAVFATKSYDRMMFTEASEGSPVEYTFIEARLAPETVSLATGHEAVCIFVNDRCDKTVLESLADLGCRAVALRCAGFNNVDLAAAESLGITVCRVPAYSPHAVAEHAVTLALALNRKIHRSFNRVREGNFELEGLLGFDLYRKTVGVIGTGEIGAAFTRIMKGFGCRVIAFDPKPTLEDVEYVELNELLEQSDIISLHCPLVEKTHHLINAESLRLMKQGVMLINTGRGALIDTAAVIKELKSGKVGYLGLDVYEEESALFFEDHSLEIISDDQIVRLLSFPNVLISGHQGFFTREALSEIARVTEKNLKAISEGQDPGDNCVVKMEGKS
ncbi:MAG: 2-hydroxyacid dehydrogenase [Verrucomicrobiales bacterium]|nr:2-hydroxyacid dehydrogenase [Verrucomicrobiales bacterium]